MSFKVYFRRAIKSIIYIAVIFVLLLGVIYIFSDKKATDMNFFDTMIPRQNQLPMLGFIIIFGLVYPFISFVRKNVYLNKPFEEEREDIMRIFKTSGYELIEEKDKKLVFRQTSALKRIMRMTEDGIELDYSDNPIVLIGMRKEVFLLGKHIEYTSMHQNMDEQ